MKAYMHTKSPAVRGGFESYCTVELPVKRAVLPWQAQGLQYTASGYGARIPTEYMVKLEGRWRRVYCRIYSNSGVLFIGKRYNECCTIQINRED